MASKKRVKQLHFVFSITAFIVGILGILPAGFSVRWDLFFISCTIAIATFLLKGIKRCPLRLKKELVTIEEPNLQIH
ncbi:MAG: hypothetical protein DRR16_11615 [Candidatus Parabeggiatoa sp. nov. 3]|nr:MAG: hypothetical protein DRR00_29555 [Gammaproteobacteria bacterium]RKZ61002.1 MAG: hypothetical protein DRQ99_21170 [Gammaproteobacteria bacterium]RKZ85614.1 MAG: hypothetical protein DRR16_11615 [Gammaproteobacteria bacterium]